MLLPENFSEQWVEKHPERQISLCLKQENKQARWISVHSAFRDNNMFCSLKLSEHLPFLVCTAMKSTSGCPKILSVKKHQCMAPQILSHPKTGHQRSDLLKPESDPSHT
jgi:hypothetical protein